MLRHYKSVIGGGILLVLPFLVEIGIADEIRIPKVKAIFFLGSLFGAHLIYRYIRPSLGIAFCGLLCSAVFSGLGPTYQLAVLACVAASIALSYLVTELNNFEIDRILGCLTIAGVLSGVMGYFQMAGHDPIFSYAPGINARLPVGFLGQQTLYGPFMASCFIAAMFRRNYAWALFILIPTLATLSSFTYASLCAGLVIWMYSEVNERAALFITILGLLAVPVLYYYFYDTHLFDATGRPANWAWIWNESIKTPLFGHGIGTFAAYSPILQPPELIKNHGLYKQAHCDYLELFFEMGIFGIGLAGYLIYDLLVSTWKNRKNRYVMSCFAICSVYLVDAVGNFPMHLSPQGLICLWTWVIVVSFKQETFVS